MFIIQSPILEKLQPEIQKIVHIIQHAVQKKQPILIRHHNDTDGYTAAIALERVILPLISEKQTRERDVFYYYTRAPCTAPYYSLMDATRDITTFLNNQTRFDTKPPLIIILDNGSSEQDIPAIKKVKIYGAEVIVIDHHPFAEEVDELSLAHLNPHKIHSTYDFSTGMLCAEIAHLLEKHKREEKSCFVFVAAVSAKADRVVSKEAAAYTEKAKALYKITEEHIQHVAEIVDHEAFVLGPAESRRLIQDLLDPTSEKHLPLVDLLYAETKRKTENQLQTSLHYVKIEDLGDKLLAIVDVEKIKQRNEYPRIGKIIGALQDNLSKTKHKNAELKPVITLGIAADSICFRCSKEITSFDVNEILALLQKQLPYAQVSGGGHRVAGSIKFVEASQQDVVKQVREYVKKCR